MEIPNKEVRQVVLGKSRNQLAKWLQWKLEMGPRNLDDTSELLQSEGKAQAFPLCEAVISHRQSPGESMSLSSLSLTKGDP